MTPPVTYVCLQGDDDLMTYVCLQGDGDLMTYAVSYTHLDVYKRQEYVLEL